jgi:preprotein translocase subunit SecD
VLHFARWKIITISAAILLAALLSLPNLLPKPLQDTFASYGIRPMTLGLDLQGGSNVLLEVDRKDMREQLQVQASSDIRASLREAKIAYSNIARTAGGVTVKISKPEDMATARERLNLLLQPQQGNILSGAATINVFALETLADGYALNITDAGITAKIATAIQQSLRIVEKRVNALGTTEPVIQQQGVDRIAVQLPGIDNPDKVKEVIGTTAKLSFQLVCEEQPTGGSQTPPQDCRAYPSKEAVDAAVAAKKAKGDTDVGANVEPFDR